MNQPEQFGAFKGLLWATPFALVLWYLIFQLIGAIR